MAPKVKVHSETEASASTELVKEALQEHIVTDARGRQIKLAKPSVLSQFRLVKMLPADVAANQTYVGMCMPLLFVAAIDGQTIIFPNTDRELDGFIERLGEEGVEAIAKGVREYWGDSDSEADKTAVKK
jgi:hypothetical protein